MNAKRTEQRLNRMRRFHSLFALLTVVMGLVALPTRTARGDAAAPFPDGTGGPSSLAGAVPDANDTTALATVNLSTGALETRFRFEFPPARGEAQPSLGLIYSSANG